MTENEIKEKYIEELTMDEPINLNGLLIYPIEMRNYYKFMMSISILMIDKNSIPDPKIISMSYLDYIIHIISNKNDKKDNKVWEFLLYTIISLSIKDNNTSIIYGERNGNSFISINGIDFEKDSFNDLKNIIIVQNMPNYKESHMNPELEKELKETERIRSNNDVMCSIEKQMVAISIGSAMSLDDIKNLTIRKFKIALEMIDKKIDYILCSNASLNGTTFKKDIKHYLVENEISLEDKVMTLENLSNKINKAKN